MSDSNMVLFGKYTLKDLTLTQTGIPNIPTDPYVIKNLVWLAKVLDQLETSVGPFVVMSAYRSDEVQNAVAGTGTKKSFHEVGMAADIYPTTMSIDKYFGILLSSEWRNKLGEIILKSDQNTLHIGLPTLKYQGSIKKRAKVNGSWTYVMMSEEEQKNYTDPIAQSLAVSGYENNDPSFSIDDPSEGALFTQFFYGLFGVYNDVVYNESGVAELISRNESNLKYYAMGVGVAALIAIGMIA